MKEYKARNGMVLNLDYKPVVMRENVDPLKIAEYEERNKFFTGTDCSVVMGENHYGTLYDTVASKLGIKQEKDVGDNWYTFKYGHTNEPLIAELFVYKTGFKLFDPKRMYKHPEYPIGCDPDYFFEYKDFSGETRTGVFDCKTISSESSVRLSKIGDEFAPKIPPENLWQMRQSMAVLNVNVAILCYVWGNRTNNMAIRVIYRDLDIEAEMIKKEVDVWNKYVKGNILPPYTEYDSGFCKPVQESVSSRLNPTDKVEELTVSDTCYNNDEVAGSYGEILEQMREHKEAIDALKKKKESYEEEYNRLKQVLISSIGTNAVIKDDKGKIKCRLSFNDTEKVKCNKSEIELMKKLYPDVYDFLIENKLLKIEKKENVSTLKLM